MRGMQAMPWDFESSNATVANTLRFYLLFPGYTSGGRAADLQCRGGFLEKIEGLLGGVKNVTNSARAVVSTLGGISCNP
jgi:hypothetical protein